MKFTRFFRFVLVPFLFGSPCLDSIAAPGEVNSFRRIAEDSGGLPDGTLISRDLFGSSCESIGDLDGDGIPELVVGAQGDDSESDGFSGAIYVLFLQSDGIVKRHVKIADGLGGMPPSSIYGEFGSSCALLGDLDGDGVPDLAVGAIFDDTGEINSGAVYILFLNRDGTVKTHTKIANGLGGVPDATFASQIRFGSSATSLGDLDNDGRPEVAVGAYNDNGSGSVYILSLLSDGSVGKSIRITNGEGGLPADAVEGWFGFACESLGDFDGDGVSELLVGAPYDGTGGDQRGAVHILFLDADGKVKRNEKIAHGTAGPGAPTLSNYERFGTSCENVGDLNGDGVTDVALGAFHYNIGDISFGQVTICFLNPDTTVKSSIRISDGEGGLPASTLSAYGEFGLGSAFLGDLDGDGIPELAVSAEEDENGLGAVYILSIGDLPIEVTTHVDEIAEPGTGTSLREAILEAEGTGEFREIRFDPSLDGQTITLDGSHLDIVDQQSVAISAEDLPGGVTISGNNQSRIFNIFLGSTLALEALTLTNGSESTGGAIYNQGEVHLIDCRVTGNTATDSGGGIRNQNTGILRINRSTIEDNKAGGGGGGGIFSQGTAFLTNSTLSGNTATGGGGGFGHSSALTTSFTHVTIAGNSSDSVGGGIHQGNNNSDDIALILRNSIVAGNTATNARADLSNNGATITAVGLNLIGSNQSVTSEFSVSALVGTAGAPVDPQLRTLGDYGGRTPTMAPLSSSPALNAGAYFPLPDTDQRGVTKSDGMPDLGAVEGVYIPPVVAAAMGLPDNSAAKAALLKKIKKLKKKLKNAKRKGQVAKAKKFKAKIKKLTKQLRAL